MKQPFLIFILCLVLGGCENQKRKPQQSQSLEPITVTKLEPENDRKPTEQPLTIPTPPKATCNCKSTNYTNHHAYDLSFQNSKHSHSQNEALFEQWSHDSLVNEVKSIRFSGFDTIPQKYSIFKNVERISLKNRGGIYGLDVFPNLYSVHFWGSNIDLTTNEKWLDQLEVLLAEKTQFTGLKSFRASPNLKVIHMAYSGFQEFPNDLESLKCLSELTMGAYRAGEIDLSTIDLSNNACLKKVEFQSWYNTLSGIPKGILASNIEDLKVHHQKLTEAEKEELNTLKSQIKTRTER